MAWDASFDPIDFEEAIAWFREKVPMTREEAAALESQVRARAFWVAHISEADLINDIMLAIDKALAEGTTLAEFQSDIAGELMARWLDDERVTDPVYRMETIFRTNIQSAYAAGRYQQQTNPAVLQVRPFWLYDALIDDRTSTVCRNLNGTLLPADDAWWDSRYPPNHFNCRSGVRSLTEAEANARGITENPTTQTPDAGWRERPTFDPPTTKDYHPSIAESVQAKIESAESES